MPTPDFEQPNSNSYVLGGYSFMRLKQYLSSPGDIFESEQSCYALGLGPDSDISRVQIAYFDSQEGGSSIFVNTSGSLQSLMTLTPDRPFAGLINALNGSSRYAPSGVPGRILISSADKYDPEYLPSTFNAGNDRVVFEPPQIDVIQYFAPPPQVLGLRSDKEYYYDSLPGAADDCYLLVPFYGRKYASIVIQNNTVVDLTTTIFTVDFQISEIAPPEIQQVAPFLQAAGTSTQQILRAAANGLHDYLLLQFDPGGGGGGGADVACKIVVSDNPG
jgi:hypothetical protein